LDDIGVSIDRSWTYIGHGFSDTGAQSHLAGSRAFPCIVPAQDEKGMKKEGIEDDGLVIAA
jgi:hypothetical protein